MNEMYAWNAVIDEITRDGNVSYVTISYAEQGQMRQTVRLVVTRDTIIRAENGAIVTVRELQRGMTVHAAFSVAMTRSIPPQATAFWIQIVSRPRAVQTTVGRIIQIDVQNQSITTICSCNTAPMIRFNLAPNAEIIGLTGRRIGLRDLWIGAQVRVEHADFMTASIPPQTTAYRIRVIG
ncbi:MAG: hypothetical protein PHV18_04860 [Lachnospiraceae bacterium]|nr:hypothetical protein [Lachnospiraceae bacterium]